MFPVDWEADKQAELFKTDVADSSLHSQYQTRTQHFTL